MAAQRAREIVSETGATYIHGFDDPDIIAGQGTLGLEILSDLPDVEAIVVGIGGGGLIAGIATAVKALQPHVRVYGVQATGAASMRAALDQGSVVALESVTTVADGIAIPAVGEHPFAITRSRVDDVVTVDDEEIVQAMLLLLERGKLLVEGAGAAAVAACLSGKFDLTGRRVVAVLSGGNIDTNQVDRFIQHGLSAQGRYMVLHVTFPDRPGELLRLLRLVSGQNANVLDVEHRRTGLALPINQVEVVLTLEMRDRAHCKSLLAVLTRHKVAFREERATVGSLAT
jgi:threonine dehydratase